MSRRNWITLLAQLTCITILVFFSKDLAQILLETAGHRAADLVVSLAVKFTFAGLGTAGLISIIKPLYYWLDQLTPYDTNKELDQNNQAAGDFASRIISAVVLGAAIIIGLAID